MFSKTVCTVFVLLFYSLNSVKGNINLNSKNLELIQFNNSFIQSLQSNLANLQPSLKQILELTKSNEEILPARCLNQLKEILNSNNAMLPFEFFDSWGKLPSGILKGNFLDMGNFNECLDIEEQLPNNDRLNGKYCLSQIPVGKLLNAPAPAQILEFKLGLCMPQACSAATIDILLKQFLSAAFNTSLDGTTLVKESSCTKGDDPFKALDYIVVILLSIFAALLVLCTLLDYVYESYKKPIHPLLSAFSVRVNAGQLFHIRSTKNNPHIITCLNGIRVISMVWIILGHGYGLNFASMAADNLLDVFSWYSSPFAILVTNALPSVDTFFFLSGLLLGMIGLRQMEKNKGKLNVLMMYLHRFLRLTPLLAMAVLVYMSIYRFMANGPLWNSESNAKLIASCDKSWWATLLYVQNYVYPTNMCLGHTWYLSVDTQLYFLSPLALIPLAKWGHKAFAGLVVVLLLFFACLFSIVMVKDISAFGIVGMVSTDRMRLTYFATHARINPWLIGLMFGYYLYTLKGRRIVLSKWLVVLGWIASLGLLATVIFSVYPSTQSGATPLTTLESAFYLSLSRIAWPLALCWIVFACVNGYGGPINDFLSCSYWEPFSKLTYSMYIWHMMVVFLTANRAKHNFHFSDYDMIVRFWSDFGLTFTVALIMHLAVEAPMAGIEKAIFAPKKNVENVEENKIVTVVTLNGHSPEEKSVLS